MNTGELLVAISRLLERFVVLPPHASLTIALWILHAWALRAFNYSPILIISSPAKRCGKTLLLELLALLLPRAMGPMIRPSEAVLYRVIDSEEVTLLLDELDALFRAVKDPTTEGLRALLNAGNRRGATVPRCVGATHKVYRFSIFGAKVCGAIGSLPETIEDRAVIIRMARKRRGDHTERFRLGRVEEGVAALREHLEAWADTAIPLLKDAEPVLPEALNDRQQDAWEALLAIADLAGGTVPAGAREAALALSTNDGDELAPDLLALRGLRDTFCAQGADTLSTHDVLTALVACDDAPFATWWSLDLENGRLQAPATRLARLLRPYGIKSKTIRIGSYTAKGYALADCSEAFDRYLGDPQLPASENATTADTSSPCATTAAEGVTAPVTGGGSEAVTGSAASGGRCDAVTPVTPDGGGPQRQAGEPAQKAPEADATQTAVTADTPSQSASRGTSGVTAAGPQAVTQAGALATVGDSVPPPTPGAGEPHGQACAPSAPKSPETDAAVLVALDVLGPGARVVPDDGKGS